MNFIEYIIELQTELKEIKSKPWFPGQGSRIKILKEDLDIALSYNKLPY